MQERLERVRAGLEQADCDAYFSFSPPTNEWLTGFRGSTSAVAVTASAAHLLCDFRYTEQAKKQARGFEVTEIAGTLETRLGEQMQALGVKTAAFDPITLTVHQLDTVQKAYDGAVRPLPELVARLRQTKSPGEIEGIRAASELAEQTFLEVLAQLEEGTTEREFAAQLDFEFKRRGAQGVSFDPIVLFGPRSSLPHGVPSGKRLERGGIVLVDCGCILDSYCSDLTRTCVFGTIPGAWFEEIYRITLEAQLAALAAVRPGKTGAEVDAAARDIIADAGYGARFGHGLGHGVGLEVHEPPRLNQESETVLEAGMVVTVEPGIYLPGRGGVRIEDLVVVTEDGCDVLTVSPKELKVLIQ